MGIFRSKPEVELLDTIETHVVDLILKITKTEAKADEYVKNQILQALDIYSERLEKNVPKKYLSLVKISKMKDLINSTKLQLEDLETVKFNALKKTTSFGNNLQNMKDYVFQIDKAMENNKIKEDECERVLIKVTTAAQELQKSPRSTLTKTEKESLSILFLKLYLKSPLKKRAVIVDNTLDSLTTVVGDLDMLYFKNVNAFDKEDLKKKLEEIASAAKTVCDITLQSLKEIDQKTETEMFSDVPVQAMEGFNYKSYASALTFNVGSRFAFSSYTRAGNEQEMFEKYHGHLKKIHDELNQYSRVIENICPPNSEGTVGKIKERVDHLLQVEVPKVPGGLKNIEDYKKIVINEGKRILHKLKNIDAHNKEINANLTTLNNIASKVLNVAESNESFLQKKQVLDVCLEEANQITAISAELDILKQELFKRIEGFLTLESSNYIRQIRKSICTHKMYAQQFAFPKRVTIYEIKKTEIISFYQSLNCLPGKNGYVDRSVCQIRRKVNEILQILDEKAQVNEDVISNLVSMEEMLAQIDGFRSRPIDIRKKIMYFYNTNSRIVKKKLEIITSIHNLEDGWFRGELTQIKSTLNQTEKEAIMLMEPITMETYREREKEILALVSEAEMKCRKLGNRQIHTYLSTIAQVIQEMLRYWAHQSNVYDDFKMLESRMSVLSTEDSASQKIKLQQYEERLNTMKKKYPQVFDEIINDIETKMNIAKSQLEFFTINDAILQLKDEILNMSHHSHPIPTNAFNETIYQIFFLRDRIEEIPEGNAELDSQKQQRLKDLHTSLQCLDEHLAKAATTQKQNEHILELNNYFNDFNPNDLGVPKNSIEFVDFIKQRAESFADRVKYYLGKSDSVDYYIIYENLLRLLEELDKMNCEDETLLDPIVKTMSFIKNLIEELKSNATQS